MSGSALSRLPALAIMPGFQVFVKDTDRELRWQVGNNPAIGKRWLPRSWWRITKVPDGQVRCRGNMMFMNTRTWQALQPHLKVVSR